MPRAGPKKVQEYSAEFKLAAVRLSRQRGVQVQAVAAALDIHPFMLSRWRKAVRDGVLRGGRAPAVKMPPAREIRRLQALERAHALLQEEHALLKKAIRFWATRKLASQAEDCSYGDSDGHRGVFFRAKDPADWERRLLGTNAIAPRRRSPPARRIAPGSRGRECRAAS